MTKATSGPVPDDEEQLKAAILDEFNWAVKFLVDSGYPGAELIVTAPDSVGARMFEFGGRFGAKSDRRSHAVIELDPGRVGWRVTAFLSICLDSEESCRTIDLGGARILQPDDVEARVLVRRAVVGLRDYLEDAPASPTSVG